MSNNNSTNNIVLVGLVILAIFVAVKVLPWVFSITWVVIKLAFLAGLVYILINERARHIALGLINQFMERLRK
jgi:hypothetical protein